MIRHMRHLLLIAVLLLLGITQAHASDCTIPNTFAAGTPAVAAEVNANFSSIQTAVNDNHSRILALQISAAALQAQITALQTESTQLQNDNAALTASASTVEANSVLALDGILTRTTDNSGYDTVRFTDVNLRIVNGTGTTDGTPNGTGNLIVGYNEKFMGNEPRSGSHNIVIGTLHGYSSYGGLVAGASNTITAPYSTVSGGMGNTASGEYSSVTAGTGNTASGRYSSVSGGSGNEASGLFASVTGGLGNTSIGPDSAVTGGSGNSATNDHTMVSGGSGNTASGDTSSISGGRDNNALGDTSSITGGFSNDAVSDYCGIAACNNCSTLADYQFQAQGTP